jgi:CheY-like chemotaxis protein
LLIEDNSDTISDFHEILSTKFEIFIFTENFNKINIKSILEINPNLIILDIELINKADTSGLKLAEMLKNNAKTRHIPIIILSFFDEHKNNHFCDLFLSKPCEEEILIDEIAKILEQN